MPRQATVDDYLASLPTERRAILQQIRETIWAAAPRATEVIAYNMPAFRLDGRFLVSFDAYKAHSSLFPASEAVRDALGAELVPYLSGRGTIRFPADRPVPLNLVTWVVQVRLGEVAAEVDAADERAGGHPTPTSSSASASSHVRVRDGRSSRERDAQA